MLDPAFAEAGLSTKAAQRFVALREEAIAIFRDYYAVRAKTMLLVKAELGVEFAVSGALYAKVWPHKWSDLSSRATPNSR